MGISNGGQYQHESGGAKWASGSDQTASRLQFSSLLQSTTNPDKWKQKNIPVKEKNNCQKSFGSFHQHFLSARPKL